MTTLGDDLPRQIARVRDEVLPHYIECGPSGSFAVMMMREALGRAERATSEGDVVEMMRAYLALKDFKV